MSVSVSEPVQFTSFPWEAKDGYPDGVWWISRITQGDASVGTVTMNAQLQTQQLSRRAISLEGVAPFSPDSVLVGDVLVQAYQRALSGGAGPVTSSAVIILDAWAATGQFPAGNTTPIPLPFWLSPGVPASAGVGTGLQTILAAVFEVNVNLANYVLEAWGFWWDTDRIKSVGYFKRP